MYADSSSLFKENYATWNNPLVAHKGENFHSCQIPLDLGLLTCFLTFEENKLLAKQKQF